MNIHAILFFSAALLLLPACSGGDAELVPEAEPVPVSEPAPEAEPGVAAATGDHAASGDHAPSEGHAAPHWGYDGPEGPGHWGELAPEFETCAAGQFQSPVDIHDAQPTAGPPLELHYSDAPLEVVNNGHTVQVNYPPGSWAMIRGKRYELLQFHFHGPSENTVDGATLDLEAHLVHKASDGSLAVVGVLMMEGAESGPMGVIGDHLPEDVGEVHRWDDVTINVTALLPEATAYWHFTGSLTTPPCTEGVDWNVMQTVMEVSHGQVEVFSTLLRSNARPVQPLHGRAIESIGG